MDTDTGIGEERTDRQTDTNTNRLTEQRQKDERNLKEGEKHKRKKYDGHRQTQALEK